MTEREAKILDQTSSALEYGFDTGLDVRLGRTLLGVRYQFSSATFDKKYYYDLTSTQNTLWFMFGYAF